jgi:hypothetical protein
MSVILNGRKDRQKTETNSSIMKLRPKCDSIVFKLKKKSVNKNTWRIDVPIFWDLLPHILMERNQKFRRNVCLHFQSRRMQWRQRQIIPATHCRVSAAAYSSRRRIQWRENIKPRLKTNLGRMSYICRLLYFSAVMAVLITWRLIPCSGLNNFSSSW